MFSFRRPLIPCVFAYAVGLWLVHDLWHTWPLLALAIGVTLAFVVGITSHRNRDLTGVLLLLIMVAGVIVMGNRERGADSAEQLVAKLAKLPAVVVSGQVSALREFDDGEKSRLVLADVEVQTSGARIAVPGRMQVNMESVNLAKAKMPVPGERVVFPGQIYPPGGLQNFFGYDRAETLRHDEIYLSARALDIPEAFQIQAGSRGFSGQISHALTSFRNRVRHNLHRDMWEREGRLMIAMLFNDMRNLKENEKADFRDSGTFHLFAVSGLHIAILGFGLNLLFRMLRCGLRGSWICTAIVLFLYLWLIDFVPSATRSYLMLLAFTIGYVLKREVDGITALFFSIALILAYDPAALWKPGFQLSVGGVSAIILITPLLRTWFPWPGELKAKSKAYGFADKAINVVCATCAVAVILLPLQIYYFGFWNALSPLANLLQAALTTFVVGAGVMVAAVGLALPGVSALMGQMASALMSAIYGISHWAAGVPGTMFYFSHVSTWLVFACYGILVGGYYLVFRDSPEFRYKSRARFATHAVCCLGILLVSQQLREVSRPVFQMWALDVGQGDSTLLRFVNGQTMLIDGGKSEPDMGRVVVKSQLRGLGIDKLDYIVATHDDDDHTGGLASIIEDFGCRFLLLPTGFVARSVCSKKMLEAAERTRVHVQYIGDGFSAQAGDCLVECLNPPEDPGAERSDNDRSLVLRFQVNDFVALLMADSGFAVEGRLINERKLGEVSVLKIGHHGSSSSTGEEFLKAVAPECTIISCGAGNKFGHPAPDVMQRLAQCKSVVLRTDLNGAVLFESDGKSISVRSKCKLMDDNGQTRWW